MNKDFNLPNLFRSTVHESRLQQKRFVEIVIPEEDKDEFIYALRDTKYGNEQVVAVPMMVSLWEITVTITASVQLSSGHMLIHYTKEPSGWQDTTTAAA